MSRCGEGKLRQPVVEWLRSRGMTPVFEVVLSGYCDVVGIEFSLRAGRYIPDLRQLCAVELKLTDVAGVIKQAVSNQYYIGYSWVAMPMARVLKMRAATLDRFRGSGVGLLSVNHAVDVIVESFAIPENDQRNDWCKNQLRKKLWRRRDEWRDFKDIAAGVGEAKAEAAE